MSGKIKLDVNMNDVPADITWRSFTDGLTLTITNPDADISLELGEDAIRQLRQALSRQSLAPVQKDKLYN